jgi:galactokinase
VIRSCGMNSTTHSRRHTYRMDQAASVISTLNSALYISFYPALSAQPIELPTELTDPSAVFVIANSLVVSDKAVSAKTQYNLRVVETLVGARILANHLGVKIGREEKVTFREVLGRWVSGNEKESREVMEVEKLKDGLEKISEELEALKPPPGKVIDGQLGVTMEEMIALSGLSEPEFHQLYLSWVEGTMPFTGQLTSSLTYQITSRSNPLPALQSRKARFLRSSPSTPIPRPVSIRIVFHSSSAEGTLRALGKLMDESHESCSEFFDCSCPELDELTALARASGAYGSRLTGAGWGGCTVSLVSENKVNEFKNKLREGYPKYRGLTD